MLFQKYKDAGLCVIPLKNGIPQVKWGQYVDCLPEDVSSWEKFKEYALICGEISNVIGLDIDTDDAETITKIESIAGKSPVKKIGSKGFTAFYKYNGERTQQWGGVVEILSNKHLTTLPPSKHREKDLNYKWVGQEIIGAELPTLNTSFVEVMNLLYPKPTYNYVPRQEYTERQIDLEQAEKMLEYISPDCDRDKWIKIGMALKDEFGDVACTLWHSWSSGSSKYKQRDTQAAWRSFHGNGITIGTLVMEAQHNGFHFDSVIKSSIEVDLSYLHNKVEVDKKINIDPYGLVGELSSWMTRTAWKPQPLLSLSASLALIGMMKGKKYITESGIYPNIYVFNIAGSACGKDRPQAAIKFLMHRIGEADKLLHAPASGPGFIDGLAAAGGHGISVIDEMAEYISVTTNKNSGGHQKKVLKYWLEAFTSCSTFIDGEKRADGSKEAPKRVDAPLFCLMGSTTPDSLTSALRGEDIGNGLLNRFLFIQTLESPRKRKFRDFDYSEAPPEAMVEKFREYMGRPPASMYGVEPSPIKVPLSQEAADLYDKIDDMFEDAVQSLDQGDRLRNLYGRAHEYVGKIALIMSDDKEINKRDVQFAYDFISLSLATALTFCGDITDTREEEDYIKARNIIKKAGEMSANDFTRKTQFIQGGERRRNEIIRLFVDSSIIHVEERQSQTKKAYWYVCC